MFFKHIKVIPDVSFYPQIDFLIFASNLKNITYEYKA